MIQTTSTTTTTKKKKTPRPNKGQIFQLHTCSAYNIQRCMACCILAIKHRPFAQFLTLENQVLKKLSHVKQKRNGGAPEVMIVSALRMAILHGQTGLRGGGLACYIHFRIVPKSTFVMLGTLCFFSLHFISVALCFCFSLQHISSYLLPSCSCSSPFPCFSPTTSNIPNVHYRNTTRVLKGSLFLNSFFSGMVPVRLTPLCFN